MSTSLLKSMVDFGAGIRSQEPPASIFRRWFMTSCMGCEARFQVRVIGVKWIRAITDIPTVTKEIICGRLSVQDYIGTIRGKKEFAVFSIKDPLPAFVEIAIWPYLWIKEVSDAVNTYILIHLLFALILLLFFVSLSRKWEINPKRSIPWSIAMTVLGSLVLAVRHSVYPDSAMALEILIAGIVPSR